MRRPGHIRGLTLIEILVVLFVVGILAVFLVPGFTNRNRQGMAIRTQCAANLKSFAQAVSIYSESNQRFLPSSWRPSDRPEGISGSRVGDRRWFPDGLSEGAATLLPNESNTRAYYKLLLGGRRAYMQPKQLICLSAAKSLGHDRSGTTPDPVIDGVERTMYDFDGTRVSRDKVEMTEFSYSFLVPPAFAASTQPASPSAWQIDRLDPGMALAADRNPYSNSVVVSPQGFGEYRFDPRAPTKLPPPPADKAAFAAALKTHDRLLNSRNHEGAGQNVSFVDGHAKWFNGAQVGADDDLIWASSELITDASGKTSVADRVPLQGADYGRMRSNPLIHTDSLLLP